jgi:RecA/RadA recombinase
MSDKKTETGGDYLISALKKAGLKSYKEAFDAGELDHTTVKLYIPTGIVPVDHILGGGFPAGRITEIYGPEAVYKSGLSQMALECCLYMGGVGLMYDNEETFDEGKSVLQDFPGFVYEISKNMEEFFASLKKNLEIITSLKDAISVALWDSLPATLPKMILESDEGERTIGEAARIMAIEIPRCKGLIRESLCALIAVNQVRANMQMANKWDNPYHTPGGHAPKFFATLRLMLNGLFRLYADLSNERLYRDASRENMTFVLFQAIFPAIRDSEAVPTSSPTSDWATIRRDPARRRLRRWDLRYHP